MAIGDVLVRIRKERNLTQEDLARKLYVTRQAVSRWENGETTPGIDMCKLIAATCDVPVALLLEMPDGAYCQSCGMPFYQEKDHGTEACHITRDEAVSFMGALLPTLKRW